MRFSFSMLIILVPFMGFSQNPDSLRNLIDSLKKVETNLQTSLSHIRSEVSNLESKLSLAEYNLLSLKHAGQPCQQIGKVTVFGASLLKEPSPFASAIGKIEGGTEVCIISDSLSIYLLVSSGDLVGWIDILYLEGKRSLQGNSISTKSTHLKQNYRPGTSRSSSSNKSTCTARQCSGYTQKGNRCSNRTTNCSGRCHYHD